MFNKSKDETPAEPVVVESDAVTLRKDLIDVLNRAGATVKPMYGLAPLAATFSEMAKRLAKGLPGE